jgi:hypothetical protein
MMRTASVERIARDTHGMTTVHGGDNAPDWATKEGWSSSSTACCMTGLGLTGRERAFSPDW